MDIDITLGGDRPVHTELFAHHVLIAENLPNTAALPPTGFSYSAIPPPFRELPSIPVRAFARR